MVTPSKQTDSSSSLQLDTSSKSSVPVLKPPSVTSLTQKVISSKSIEKVLPSQMVTPSKQTDSSSSLQLDTSLKQVGSEFINEEKDIVSKHKDSISNSQLLIHEKEINPNSEPIVSESASQSIILFKKNNLFSPQKSTTFPKAIDTLSKSQSLIVYKEKDQSSTLQSVTSSSYIPISCPQLDITSSNHSVSSSEFVTVTSSNKNSIQENQSTNNQTEQSSKKNSIQENQLTNNQTEQSSKKNLKIGEFFINTYK